jgi:hypothetical protein
VYSFHSSVSVLVLYRFFWLICVFFDVISNLGICSSREISCGEDFYGIG